MEDILEIQKHIDAEKRMNAIKLVTTYLEENRK